MFDDCFNIIGNMYRFWPHYIYCMHMHVRMYVGMYLCMYACMYVHTYVCT